MGGSLKMLTSDVKGSGGVKKNPKTCLRNVWMFPKVDHCAVQASHKKGHSWTLLDGLWLSGREHQSLYCNFFKKKNQSTVV